MRQKTFYNENFVSKKKFSAVSEDLECDIAVIGAGLAGLALCFELSKHHANVVLIDSGRIGDGASGLNGGFCSPGWSANELVFYKKYGKDMANIFASLSLEGLSWVKSFEKKEGFEEIDIRNGTMSLSLLTSENLGRKLFMQNIADKNLHEFISGSELQHYIGSRSYQYGVLSKQGFHFNPLEFLNALKICAYNNSTRIFENSKMIGFSESESLCQVHVDTGYLIKCKKLVLATGGYGGAELGFLASRWLPIKTFICTTSPMGKVIGNLIKQDLGFSDDRRAGNYFRRVGGDRLLWGRGISALGKTSLKKVSNDVQKDIKSFFPDLIEEIGGEKMLNIEYKWHGEMAYSFNMMPCVGQLSRRVFALTGFGGHGMNTAPIASIILAEYLTGRSNRLSFFNKIALQWNGWKFGRFIAETAYRLMGVQDRLKTILIKYF